MQAGVPHAGPLAFLPVVEVQLDLASAAAGGVEKEKIEAAAGGRPEGLLGVVVEVFAAQPATGRCKREGARTSRHPPVRQRRAWPRSTRRAGTWVAAAGSLCVRLYMGCACAGLIQGPL